MCGEFVDIIKKRFCTVLPASRVLHHKKLRLSPLGVAPQHEQQPQVVCDHTFFGVNQDTTPTAPPEAMQFSKMPPGLLQPFAFLPTQNAAWSAWPNVTFLTVSSSSNSPLTQFSPRLCCHQPLQEKALQWQHLQLSPFHIGLLGVWLLLCTWHFCFL